MISNNRKLDLVNINAYIKFGENMSSSSQDIERKRNFGIKGHNSGTNLGKLMCNNPKLDHVNINAQNLNKFYKRFLKIFRGNKKL